jgi:hypothetical protein
VGNRCVLLSALLILSAFPFSVTSAHAQAADPRLGQAVGWAEEQLVARPQGWNRGGQTFCGQFVEDAYAVPPRLRAGHDTAWQIFLDIGTSSTTSTVGARPGDIVFFQQNVGNSYAGHAGIYLGGDTMISVTDSGLPQSDVSKWSKYVAPLAGYVAPPPDWPGVGNTTPSSFSLGGACSEGGLGGGTDPPASADGHCTFQLGFQSLRHLIPDVVGWCSANEYFDAATGDTQQATTEGLLVWRKADNWTAFTDGYHTWINGPNGLQERMNSQRFSWEGTTAAQPFTYVNDFSQYPVGQSPNDWDQFGTTLAAPYVEDVGGQGPAYRQLIFPRLPGGNTDKWLINRALTCAQATATVKVVFWDTIADSAGLGLVKQQVPGLLEGMRR